MNKKIIPFICLAIFLYSCGQKKSGNTAQNNIEQDTTNIVQDTIDLTNIEKNRIDVLSWVIENDTMNIFYKQAQGSDKDEIFNLCGKNAIFDIDVYFKGKSIYKNTDYYYSIEKDDIKFIKYNNTNYVLITTLNMPFEEFWLIFEIKNHNIKKVQYHIIKDILKDIDNDGIFEVGGSGMTEAVCIDCDSAYYNPERIYKLGNTLTFDSINSRKLTEEFYDRFLGYEYLDSIVIRKNN